MPVGEYTKTLVTYLDILGFAELVDRSRSSPAEISRIQHILAALNRVGSAGPRPHEYSESEIRALFESFNFSDLTVRAIRVNDMQYAKFVDWELFYLAEHQLTLAAQGVLLRGGICMGDLLAVSEQNLIFGPALVKAYRLESGYAIYPRIVIDRQLIFDADQAGYKASLQDYIARGENGAYFLDYLFGASITEYVLGSPDVARQHIIAHRDMIEAAINDDIRTKDERLKQKYMWLGLYHNNGVKRLHDRHPGMGSVSALFIPESSLNF